MLKLPEPTAWSFPFWLRKPVTYKISCIFCGVMICYVVLVMHLDDAVPNEWAFFDVSFIQNLTQVVQRQ